MRIKRYVARTMQDALDAVRQEFGPDAVILHTRKARRRGLAALFGGERFEVIAALDADGVASRNARRPRTAPGPPEPARGPAFAAYQPPQRTGHGPGLEGTGATRAVEHATREAWPRAGAPQIGGVAGAYVGTGGVGADAWATLFVEVHERLLDADVDPDLAEAIIQAARMRMRRRDAQAPGTSPHELVLELIADAIPVAGGVDLAAGSRRVVALVGPTGVGKTTTLAKIAALTALFGRKRVAFITADTYRIAAVEQLRTYAEIIGVPCEVVYTPSEMRQAVASLDDRDLVLIDTAGRSPRSGMHMAELRAFLEAAQVDEAHLVLSMTTRPRDLMETVERFAPCGANRLIFSKLDETTHLGAILGVASSVRIPVSYVTYGQNVPEDIEVADASLIARWILAGGIGNEGLGADAGAGAPGAEERASGGSGAGRPAAGDAERAGDLGGARAHGWGLT